MKEEVTHPNGVKHFPPKGREKVGGRGGSGRKIIRRSDVSSCSAINLPFFLLRYCVRSRAGVGREAALIV